MLSQLCNLSFFYSLFLFLIILTTIFRFGLSLEKKKGKIKSEKKKSESKKSFHILYILLNRRYNRVHQMYPNFF